MFELTKHFWGAWIDLMMYYRLLRAKRSFQIYGSFLQDNLAFKGIGKYSNNENLSMHIFTDYKPIVKITFICTLPCRKKSYSNCLNTKCALMYECWASHTHAYILPHKRFNLSHNKLTNTHSDTYIAENQAAASCEWSNIVTPTYMALSHCGISQWIIPSNKSCLEDNPFPIFWTDTFCNEMAPGPSL